MNRHLVGFCAIPFGAGLIVGCQGASDHSVEVADARATSTDGAAATGDASLAPADAAPACTGLLPQPADNVWTLEVDGRERSFRVHVPATYDPAVRTPLVLNFHGFTSNAAQQELLTLMPIKADDAGFITVAADGVGASWNAGACCGQAVVEDIDDVGFVTAMLDELEASLCIDPARVYATGFSNGGFLSHRLACELSTRIAAVAPVSGVLGIDTCAPSRPVPVLQFHGTADPVVPYGGNPVLGFESVATTIGGWVERNGCDATAEVYYENGDVTCERYSGCDAGATVALCTIDGGVHTWPGGTLPPATTNISATDAMWDFFIAHPMP
ncbi:MAG TPA: PHB depolymerase family esterase [Kofleriaceae bacterium]|nr:PHB depolymerase family esterase [Kofleriaceae bacterium]